MALPNGSGGYQIGDGNLTEALLDVQDAPVALTAAATLTAAQLVNGLITVSLTGAGANIQLPIVVTASGVTGVNDVVSSAKTNSAFEFNVINLTASSYAATVTVGTGWTIVGAAAVSAATSGHFMARKTSEIGRAHV